MRYLEKTGYDAIVALEAEKALESFAPAVEKLGKEASKVMVSCGCGKTAVVDVNPGDTVAAVLAKAGIPGEDKEIRGIHIGYPVGGIFRPENVLDKPLTGALLTEKGLSAGSLEIRVITKDECTVDYMLKLTKELQGDSCGRCVFCREGFRQMYKITEDITNQKMGSDDLDLLKLLADGMLQAAHCLYGRAVGALWLEVLAEFAEEFEGHVRRKRCEPLVCRKYFSYHILGSKCKGCTDCLDECPREAIEGEDDYIHVIDQFECDRCGKCLEVCKYDAIVKAGAIKPKTPDEPIPVGKWKGK